MALHLGSVPSGSTLYIPFTTYDSNGASVTMSAFATTDILIYKDGSVTQRASTSGFTLLDTDGIDFDAVTGLHGFSINLADNTDAGFYAVGSQYWVVVSTITVSAQTVTALAATFRIVAAENTAGYPVVDTAKLSGTTCTARDIGASVLLSSGAGAGQLDFTSGVVKANVTQYNGTNGTFAAGRPEVNASHIAGSAVSTASAQIGVNVVNAGGTAWGSGAITAAAIADGAIDRATFAADTGLQSIRSATAQAGGATSITLDAGASATNNYYRGAVIFATGGTGVGQYRLCTAYDGTTKVATVTPAWVTNPDVTTTFAILPHGMTDIEALESVAPSTHASGMFPADLRDIAGSAVSASTAQLGVNVVNFGGAAGTFAAGRPEVNTTHVGGTAQTAGDIIGDTNDIQARLPAALVAGRIDASVGAYQTGLTPLQPTVAGRTLDVTLTGEAGIDLDNTAGTLAKGTDLTGFNDLDAAGIRTAVGLALANLDTQLTTIGGYVDTEVAAIKAKTDQLTFTVAGQVDANIQSVNDTLVTGAGTDANPWGP